MESNKKLTPRQWELYRLIYHNSMVEHRKTTQKEICDTISGYEWNDDVRSHDHCSAIWKDIKDNNESFEHDKIIISKNFEYWIGSETETRKYLQMLWENVSARLTRYWNYVKKTQMDGQGKLIDKNGNVINDMSKARAFFECYNNYNIEMQQQENGDDDELTKDL